MSYTSGETPKLRDRISDEDSRVGTVLDIAISNRGAISEIVVRWDDGAADLRYDHAGNFRLMSRAPGLYIFNPDAARKYNP
jgi:hypothetical protein